jgi:hypothetical protein
MSGEPWAAIFVTAFTRGGDGARFLVIAATVAQHKPGVAP